MKILFDANLSPTLVTSLHSEYPGSRHVRDAGLREAPDAEIWEYAKAHGFAIVSKDTDFRKRSFVEGFPPKVVWLDVGNAGTTPIQLPGLLASLVGHSSGPRPSPRASLSVPAQAPPHRIDGTADWVATRPVTSPPSRGWTVPVYIAAARDIRQRSHRVARGPGPDVADLGPRKAV